MGTTKLFVGVILVMGVGMYFLFNAYTGQVEARVTESIRAGIAEVRLESQKEISTANQTANNTLAIEQARHAKKEGETQNELTSLRLTAERDAQVDPLGFGTDINTRISRLFCLFEATGNSDRVETCRSAPSEAYTSNVSLFITVTPEQAERWEEQCDDARDGTLGRKFLDSCHWSVTGMTPQGVITLLSALASQARHGQDMDAFADTLADIIGLITEQTPGPKEGT